MAANKFEEYTRGTMRYFEDAMAASTTPALTTEVHRLVHQDTNMGALLRELRDSEEGQELAVYPDFSQVFSFVAISSAAPTAPRMPFSIAHLTPSARQ